MNIRRLAGLDTTEDSVGSGGVNGLLNTLIFVND